MRGPLSIGERLKRAIGSFQSYSKREKGFLARIEYWVFLPGAELPPQDSIMNRMLTDNPHRLGSRSPIGSSEALLFSDVRLGIALVLKERNPRIFRASVFPEHLDYTPDQVEAMQASQALVKVSFVSEQPVRDRNVAGFIAHASDSVAELGGASLIYDLVGERLWSPEQFSIALTQTPTANSSDLHLRVFWISTPEGGRVETRGLQKVGLSDLRTVAMERDERVLVHSVIELAAEQIWTAREWPPDLKVTLFDDLFLVTPGRTAGGFTTVRVLRVESRG